MYYYKSIDIINIISCFQLAIFIFFLIHMGRKKKSNVILAIFFGVQMFVLLCQLLTSFFHNNNISTQINHSYHPFEFLWGPLMYFYVKSNIKEGFKFKFFDIVHLIPFILISILIISGNYFSKSGTYLPITSIYLMHLYFNLYNLLYFLILFAYNFSALSLLFKYQQNLKNYYSFEVKQNLLWLKFILYGYIIACIVALTASYASKFTLVPNEYISNILYATFLAFFNILFYRAMIQPQALIQLDDKPKYFSASLSINDIDKYSQMITIALTTNKRYLNPSLSLQELSEATGISERNISQVINKYWKQNFFSFINSFRVEEAKSLLNNFNQNKTTMLGIAFDSGFNSKSAFYDAFKKHTGITPTEYRKLKA